MERRIKEINRFTVGWTAYFGLADTILPFENLDQWLQPTATAGALEGVEASPNTLPEPPRARYHRAATPAHGRPRSKGYWRIAGSWPSNRPAQRLLAPDLGLQGFADPYRRFREC